MSVASMYSEAVREQLLLLPVYPPGLKLKLGDTGYLHEGVFHREGSLLDEWGSAPLDSEEVGDIESHSFHSDEGVQVSVGAEVELPTAGAAEAKARVEFSRAGATVFDSRGVKTISLKNIDAVLDHMRANKKNWPRGKVVVTHVMAAENFAVLVSQSKNAAVELSGDVEPIQELQIADASIDIGLKSGAVAGYSGSGPLLLRAYGRRGLLGRIKPAAADAEPDLGGDDEFGEVSPLDDSHVLGGS